MSELNKGLSIRNLATYEEEMKENLEKNNIVYKIENDVFYVKEDDYSKLKEIANKLSDERLGRNWREK